MSRNGLVYQQVLNINGGKTIKERPSTPVIIESQKFIRARIERRWLQAFKKTAEFIDRQAPRNNVQEVVEDVMLKKRMQRSEAALKVLPYIHIVTLSMMCFYF